MIRLQEALVQDGAVQQRLRKVAIKEEVQDVERYPTNYMKTINKIIKIKKMNENENKHKKSYAHLQNSYIYEKVKNSL